MKRFVFIPTELGFDEELSDEDLGKLLKAWFKYVKTFEEPKFDSKSLNFAWGQLKVANGVE